MPSSQMPYPADTEPLLPLVAEQQRRLAAERFVSQSRSASALGEENISRNTRTSVGKVDGKVHRVAVSINGTFVKAYIDNARVINDPDGAKRPIT